ncbi:MAG TPA: glycosyltransferase family 2 protein [Myxococcota bacterium]|nr:glycosyltransferase family 2 protein [Myxococcota bacterium]
MIAAVLAASLLVALLLVAAVYRAIFTFAFLLRGDSLVRAPEPSRQRRFAVVVPAHDEESFIGDVIATIRRADYPRDRIEIHVVADNCSDRTAERVRALGEHVAERHDLSRRGKGAALEWMLERLDLERSDAVAIVDADVEVDPGFFRAMNRELERGARCLQGFNGICNPDASTMTRLLAVTYVMKNLLFNGGKAALGLSVSLSGTGMVLHCDVLRRIGWKAMTIGEDLEQSIYLLERGERIRFVPDAIVLAQESTSLGEAYAQRQRWVSGRFALHRLAWRSLLAGLRARSLERVDQSLELLMPNYSTMFTWSAVAFAVSLLLVARAPWLLAGACVVIAYQLCELGISLRLMRVPPGFVRSLAFAPVFLAWRAAIDVLALVGHRRDRWGRRGRTRPQRTAEERLP